MSLCVGATFKHDPAPQIIPAGKVMSPDEGGVRADLTQVSLRQRPETPDSIKPFRNSFVASVGKVSRHYGLRNDPDRDPSTIYGRRGESNGSVEGCLNPASQTDKMNTLAAENAEKRYRSHRQEPLGRVPDPSIPIPAVLSRTGFGVTTRRSESAKNIIYSCGEGDGPQLHPAGAQATRDYDWSRAQIDPSNYRFGFVNAEKGTSASDLLNPQVATSIQPKVVADFKSVANAHLSQTKNLGFGTRNLPSDHAYGQPSVPDVYSAHQLITGVAHLEHDMSSYNEDSLGKVYVKSLTLRRLKQAETSGLTEGTPSRFGNPAQRTFGVPSIRSDLRKPDEQNRKITHGTNYGDDATAKQLLYPSHYVGNNIGSKYYSSPRTLDEIKELCAKLQFGLTDDQIERAFSEVQKNGLAAPEDFKNAVNRLF